MCSGTGTALHNAHNAQTARQLVESVEPCKQKEFILSVDRLQYTALHRAAEAGRTDVVEYLCNFFRVDDELILKRNIFHLTALHYAQNSEIAKLLVQSVKLPENQKTFLLSDSQNGCTALHTAAEAGRTDVVEYLCSLSPTDDELIVKRGITGCTALHHAANTEVAKLLVESVLEENKKTFILSTDRNQCTALHFAAEKGTTDVVEYICSLPLAGDELILKKDAKGCTALHYAKNREVAKLLVESVLINNNKTFILSIAENYLTALHRAALVGRTDVVKYLCTWSSTDDKLMSKRGATGWTALHLVENSYISMLLVESDLEKNKATFFLSIDRIQITVLHIAAEKGTKNVVEYLYSLSLANDELILKENNFGLTALHYAKNREIAKLLVESVLSKHQKSFISSVNENLHTALPNAALGGLTSLHEAAGKGTTDVVKYLCNLPLADDELILKKDVKGQTALHYAKNREVAKLLVESVLPENKKTFILSVDETQFTALHRAAVVGRTDVVEYLCTLSSTDDELILKKDANGWTALHCAKNKEVAKLLVESVLGKNQTGFLLTVDRNKYTALHSAAAISRTDVVEYLCTWSCTNGKQIHMEKNIFGRTALHYAKNREIAKWLWESDLPENQESFLLSVDENLCTALHTATMFEQTQVVEYLCSCSESSAKLVFVPDIINSTAIHYAANKEMVSSMLGCLQNEEIVELLSDPNDKGNTPLMSLAEIGQHKSLAELLEQAVNLAQWDEWKAYFKQRNYENQNILHLAARSFSLDNIYDVLSECLSNLNFEELMYPDVHGNTPIQYVAAKYNTKIFADFMLRLPLPMRQKIADFSNSKLANCRNIINQKAFSELNYIKNILADENHKSLVSKYEHTSFLMRGWKQITHPEKFYKYDETIFKVLKYCLNEYSLLDSAYTISYSLSLAAVCQQKSEQRNRVSNIFKICFTCLYTCMLYKLFKFCIDIQWSSML